MSLGPPIYVSTTGNNAASGDEANPVADMETALGRGRDAVLTYTSGCPILLMPSTAKNPHIVTPGKVGAGIYGQLPGSHLTADIRGMTGNPEDVIVEVRQATGFYPKDFGIGLVHDLTVKLKGGGRAFDLGGKAILDFGNLILDAEDTTVEGGATFFNLAFGAQAGPDGPITLKGTPVSAIVTVYDRGSIFDFNSQPFNIPAGQTWDTFAVALEGGTIKAKDPTVFRGVGVAQCIGRKFSKRDDGQFFCNGLDPNSFFPGSVNG